MSCNLDSDFHGNPYFTARCGKRLGDSHPKRHLRCPQQVQMESESYKQAATFRKFSFFSARPFIR
jgi:hypothetical protein